MYLASFLYTPSLTVATQSGTFEEAEASFRSQIKVLEEDLTRQKVSCRLIRLPSITG